MFYKSTTQAAVYLNHLLCKKQEINIEKIKTSKLLTKFNFFYLNLVLNIFFYIFYVLHNWE